MNFIGKLGGALVLKIVYILNNTTPCGCGEALPLKVK